jgi:anti-anti-sigma factor
VQAQLCIIKPQGDLTWEIGSDFSAFLRPYIADTSITEVFFDFSLTNYLDSTSLGIIAHFLKNARKRNCTVKGFAPKENVQRILDDVGFSKIMEISTEMIQGDYSMNEISFSSKKPTTDMAVLLRDAHKMLTEIDEKNRSTFSNVIRDFEQDIENKSQSDG